MVPAGREAVPVSCSTDTADKCPGHGGHLGVTCQGASTRGLQGLATQGGVGALGRSSVRQGVVTPGA